MVWVSLGDFDEARASLDVICVASYIDYVPGLKKLGLTEYEAKIYATLIKAGSKTAGELAFLSSVPRTKMYGSLRELEKKGLVKVLRQKPEKYIGTSPNEFLFPLAEGLVKEAEESLEQVQNLALAYESMKLLSSRRVSLKTELATITGRSTISENTTKLFAAANESVDMVTSASGLVRFYKSQSKSIDRLISKRIKVRLISNVTPQTLSIARELKNVLQVRTSSKLDSEVMIIDSHTIVVVEAMPDDLADESSGDLAVISENLQVISSFKNLFEITWATLPSNI